MGDLSFPPRKRSIMAETLSVQDMPITTSQLIGAAAEDAWRFSLSSSISRTIQLERAKRDPEEPTLKPEEANERYGIENHLKFSEPVKDRVARYMNERKQEEIEFRNKIDRAKGVAQHGLVFGTELGVTLFDPMNVAAMFIPVVNEARTVAIMDRFGKTGGRFIKGAIEGAVGNAAIEPIILYAATEEGAQYTAVDSAINVGIGAILGGTLHSVGGAFGDWYFGAPKANIESGQKAAIKQFAEGEQIDVEALVGAHVDSELNATEVNLDGTKVEEFEVEEIILKDHTPSDIKDTPVSTEASQKAHHILIDTYKNNGWVPAKKYGLDHDVGIQKTKDFINYAKATNKVPRLQILFDINSALYPPSSVQLRLINLTGYSDSKDLADAALNAMKIAGFDSKEFGGLTIQELGTHSNAKSLASVVKITLGEAFWKQENVDKYLGNFHKSEFEENTILAGKMQHGLNESGADDADAFLKFQDTLSMQVLDPGQFSTGPKTQPQQDFEKVSKAQATKLKGQDAITQAELFKEHDKIINDTDLEIFDTSTVSSHEGGFAKHRRTGETYFVKYPKDKDQAVTEYLAGNFYKHAGIKVPKIRLVRKGKEIVGIASQVDEGTKPVTIDYLVNTHRKSNPADWDEFANGIVIDMWMGNWDVAANGNLLLRGDGTILRIDHGGTMFFRAQGSLKDAKEFSTTIQEFNTFKDPSKNPNTAMAMDHIEKGNLEVGAGRLAQLSEQEILQIIESSGINPQMGVKLESILLGRRFGILKKYPKYVKEASSKKSPLFKEIINQEEAVSYMLAKKSQFDKTLNSDEQSAVASYKGSSGDVNGALRKGTASPVIAEKIGHLLSATEKMHLDQPITLWRGGVPFGTYANPSAPLGIKNLQDAINSIDHVVYDKGFTSTATGASAAFTGTEITLKIKAPVGQKGFFPSVATGKYQGEAEFVLPPSTPFRIKQAWPDPVHPSRIVILMEIVPQKPKSYDSKAIIDAAEAANRRESAAADIEAMEEEAFYSLRNELMHDKIQEDIQAIEAEYDAFAEELHNIDELADELAEIDQVVADQKSFAESISKAAKKAFGCIIGKA